MKFRQITTYIDEQSYSRLLNNSYKGKRKLQSIGQLTFSEHIRKALKEYCDKNEFKEG